MNKRQLSKQQRQRIAKQQQHALGDDSGPLGHDHCNGRVVSHYGKQLQVEALGEGERGRLLHCHQRANLPELVTGDLVVWEAVDGDSGVVIAQGQRRNVFARPDSRGRNKALAANLDNVMVVFAVSPEPFMNLIDRYLVALENLGLPPVLVLNKTDLLESGGNPEIDKMLSIYESLGYPVHRLCAQTGTGMTALEAALEGQTTMLVGQSGVGKSSLINRLAHRELTEIGELSAARGKGTHTTTTARLFHLPHCDLIDSPGIREFRLEHLQTAQLEQGFKEFRDLAGQCNFRNCSHRGEPGCALQAALDNGRIHPERWQSYCHMRNSLPTS